MQGTAQIINIQTSHSPCFFSSTRLDSFALTTKTPTSRPYFLNLSPSTGRIFRIFGGYGSDRISDIAIKVV